MDIHYLEAGGHDIALTQNASFWLGKGDVLAQSSTPPGANPTQLKVPQWQAGRNGIMPWGEDNNFPKMVVDLYNQDPIIPKTLGNQAAMLMGRGIMPVMQTLEADNKEVNTPVNDPEIWEFLRSPGMRQYMKQGSNDLLWFFNLFPEFILSKNREKILQVKCQQAAFSRYSAVNPEGRCEHVYISGSWPSASITDTNLVTKVAALDPMNYDRVNWLREHSDYKFIYPLSYPSPDKVFYSLAHHDSIRTSGWLDVHLAIPQFKKFLMQNQMSIKYHFKVDVEFWRTLHGPQVWDKASPEQRLAWKKEWLVAVEKNLTDVTKTGNSILTDMTFDQGKGVMMDHIQVLPVTDTMKDGKFIDDSMEAAAKIFYALGMDPTIPGFASDKMGGNMGGSSKREAWLIALALMYPYRDLMLEPLDFVAQYNGWTRRWPNLTFLFRDTVLTTLDQGKGTQKVVS